jgi:hypothetical protein
LRYTTPDKKINDVIKTIGGVYKINELVSVVISSKAPYVFIGLKKK